ncbi:MAG: 50S ribosomal protein L32 [Nitriliruptor sp.]
MAVPKRKLSRSRTRHRKAQWLKTAAPTVTNCSRCKAPTRPHTVCGTCGTYGGRVVTEPK